MPLQTTYTENMLPGAVGRRANMEEWNTITRTNSGATAIGFGQPVERGANAHTAVIWDGTGSFLGITEADPGIVPPIGGTVDTFPQYASMPINRMGVIWVMSGGACTAGGPVYWIAASGKYTNTSAGNVLIPNAEFEITVAGTDTLVTIRHNQKPV